MFIIIEIAGQTVAAKVDEIDKNWNDGTGRVYVAATVLGGSHEGIQIGAVVEPDAITDKGGRTVTLAA